MDIQQTLKEAGVKMDKAIDAHKKVIGGIRTGRASAEMLSHVKAVCYGASMPINQIARISVGDARLLVIEPWDSNMVAPIVKAVQLSDLGITPQVEGQLIHLVIPSLNEERRKEMARAVKARLEESKVAIRNIRRDALDNLRSLEKSGDCSQDDLHRAQGKLQGMTDSKIATVANMASDKEAEITAV